MMLEPLGLAVAQGRVSIIKDLASFGAPLDRDVISRALDPDIISWLEQVKSTTSFITVTTLPLSL
jgi:hypothetical protein